MAAIEVSIELQKKIEETGPPDLLIGVAGPAARDALRNKAADLRGLPAKTVVAYIGGPAEAEPSLENGVQLAAYPVPPPSGSLAFWADTVASYRNVVALAGAWGPRACMVVHNDLAALDADTVRNFTGPVLEQKVDLVMPIYAEGRYDGLITKSLLAPLTRALYGRRVKSPLPLDFCAGGKALAAMAENMEADKDSLQLLWPSNAVAMKNGQIGQAAVNVQHAAQTDGLELSDVLAELAGALFQEAEECAAEWQRVRGSQPSPRFGEPCPPRSDEQQDAPIDATRLVESFVIGSRNLEEVWRLVLPPASMLELRRLARLQPEEFRMPDALWARIVYDFALAYRLRRVSRTHVLGAMAPLYLGWVASYAHEVGGVTAQEADRRVEQLARAYEEQKPYFVSRWRWPERLS
jgi:hypothetical protein